MKLERNKGTQTPQPKLTAEKAPPQHRRNHQEKPKQQQWAKTTHKKGQSLIKHTTTTPAPPPGAEKTKSHPRGKKKEQQLTAPHNSKPKQRRPHLRGKKVKKTVETIKGSSNTVPKKDKRHQNRNQEQKKKQHPDREPNHRPTSRAKGSKQSRPQKLRQQTTKNKKTSVISNILWTTIVAALKALWDARNAKLFQNNSRSKELFSRFLFATGLVFEHVQTRIIIKFKNTKTNQCLLFSVQ
ncbi:hypothetical protein LXL04_011689 [Taraxacum kok-saghyz]